MAKTLSMNYTLNTDSPWIYCNYPERVTEEHLGENGHFINRQLVSTGVGQLFYEHSVSAISEPLHHGIRIYNKNTKDTLFYVLNYGHAHRTAKNTDMESAESWEKFFKADHAKKYVIPARKSIWICEEDIPAGCGIFTGNLRFKAYSPVVLATYIYKNRKDIPAKTTCIPYDPTQGKVGNKVYSGVGQGSFFTADPHTIKVSQLLKDDTVRFVTHARSNTDYKINGVSGKKQHEFIPLKLVSDPELTAEYLGDRRNDPLHNLGNWCAQYYFPFVFKNDTNREHSIQCRVFSNSVSKAAKALPIINCGGDVVTKVLSLSEDTEYWDWKTLKLPSHSEVKLDYQFILGANSMSDMEHRFILKK